MLSITELIGVLEEESISRREVAHGYGGMAGRFLGSTIGGLTGYALSSGLSDTHPEYIYPSIMVGGITGNIVGDMVGKSTAERMIDRPDAAADFSKASHRVGILGNRQLLPMATTTSNVLYPLMLANNVVPTRGLVVRGITTAVNAMPGGPADQMGYKLPGRIGTALVGPLGGLVAPSEIKKNR